MSDRWRARLLFIIFVLRDPLLKIHSLAKSELSEDQRGKSYNGKRELVLSYVLASKNSIMYCSVELKSMCHGPLKESRMMVWMIRRL